MENLELKGLHVDELQKLRVMDSELANQVNFELKNVEYVNLHSPIAVCDKSRYRVLDDSFKKRVWRLRRTDRRFSEDDGWFHRTLGRGDKDKAMAHICLKYTQYL